MTNQKIGLEKIDEYRYRIPKTYKPGMRTDGIIYTSGQLLESLLRDKAIEQVANVSFLPGIVKSSLAMPDIHWGYGFPIGGVAATDIEKGGVVSPGGVGFDINCGVRLVKTNLFYEDIREKIPDLLNVLYHTIPAGVGSKGSLRLSEAEEEKLLLKGAAWMVAKGYGTSEDLECTEAGGQLPDADPSLVSQHAYERGKAQVGTLGSGNHFLEIQVIDKIFEEEIAAQLNLFKGQIVIMIHSGSRGLGHQVCTDYLKVMLECLKKYEINVPDRQLACAPVDSKEGRAYLGAMSCAANYAWANRQMLMHLTRMAFEQFFKTGWQKLQMNLIYDVAHNIAKKEQHIVNGEKKSLCVHRKGATRAFGPGHPELPQRYRNTGQPVIIPGDMGRNSYLLVGTQKAMDETFGSTCHGAGRLMSRSQAIRTLNPKKVIEELRQKNIIVRSAGKEIISEEAPQAYKDVNVVVDVVHSAGISKKVCRMRPLGVIKG
ncbi:MAG: RtcB family protein [Candidatus Omnitrophica bacterium]|nr:RtcB family protein [Candidatus Omnitrophota bacterium]MBU4478055.1 RtcB family protein [Candidatus Omnitrophota bacterium]